MKFSALNLSKAHRRHLKGTSFSQKLLLLKTNLCFLIYNYLSCSAICERNFSAMRSIKSTSDINFYKIKLVSLQYKEKNLIENIKIKILNYGNKKYKFSMKIKLLLSSVNNYDIFTFLLTLCLEIDLIVSSILFPKLFCF